MVDRMIRVALLGDPPLLAGAADITVVAAAANEAALVRALDGRRPDVVVLQDRGDALARCRRIKARVAPPRVVLHTAHASGALAIAARAAQADALVDDHTALLDVIRRVADGETVIPGVGREDFEAAAWRLEDRDLPVFAMLLDGMTVPAIATALRCSEREAARRAQHVVRRLGPRLAVHAWRERSR
jgi:DNA-binding NarL/FixJ family response regulator